MRRTEPSARWLACLVASLATSACFASHGVGVAADAGGAGDARAPDGAPACVEGAACDDGDPCTRDDACRAGSCVGAPITCALPPPCFASPGVCVGGACVYAPDDGAACDDGDPCTRDDACEAGACRGAPLACDTPPAPVCTDARTLRTFEPRGACEAGSCAYAARERDCIDGCVSGACRCDPAPWAPIEIESGVHGGAPPAIVVDGDGGLHVSYGDAAADLIRYAHRSRDSAAWSVEPVSTNGRGTAIGIVPPGEIHVVYLDPPRRTLVDVTRATAGGWARVDIAASAGAGTDARMAIADDGAIHLSFARATDPSSPDLMHAVLARGGWWRLETVDGPGAVGLYSAIAVDGAGVHVSYYASDSGTLRYAHEASDGVWQVADVGDAAEGATAIAVDELGDVHVTYLRASGPSGTELWHAHRTEEGTWTLERVDDAVTNGALAVDADGVLHATYHRSGSVLYARRDPSGAWELEPINEARALGSALALDRWGGVHVVYATEPDASGAEPPAIHYAFRRRCE